MDSASIDVCFLLSVLLRSNFNKWFARICTYKNCLIELVKPHYVPKNLIQFLVLRKSVSTYKKALFNSSVGVADT